MALRPKDTKELQYIEHCPSCGSPLEKKEGDAKHYCLNTKGCKPQVVGKIVHFISRKSMQIEGLGEETVEMLFDNNIINNVADLYELQASHLLPLDRMAEKSVDNILKAIESSKTKPFEKVLFALGIRFVGETVAKKIAKYFKNIDNLMQASFLKPLLLP